MAKVTITLFDDVDENGDEGINLDVQFDPVVEGDVNAEDLTGAQFAGAAAVFFLATDVLGFEDEEAVS